MSGHVFLGGTELVCGGGLAPRCAPLLHLLRLLVLP